MAFAFRFSIDPIRLHPSITYLYNESCNTKSTILKRFHHLTPHIAHATVSPKCPEENKLHHFTTKISNNSARSRIKSHCNAEIQHLLCETVQAECPEHLIHLPSMLSPHMPYPLVTMSCSNPGHRLNNWNFLYAMLRKLRLPILTHLTYYPRAGVAQHMTAMKTMHSVESKITRRWPII